MPSSTASCTPRTASRSTATPCANHRKNPASVASLTRTPPSEPLKPSMGAAVRNHRNAVRDQSESLSAINRNPCPQSPESAFNAGGVGKALETAVLLSAKAERRLRTTVREMTPPNWGRSLAACMKDHSRYLNGWVAHFRLCTAEAVNGLRAIDAHIRRRFRA